MSSICSIRKATGQDMEALIELLKELHLGDPDFSSGNETLRRGLQLMLDNSQLHCIMVAEKEGRGVIGMCTVQTLFSVVEGGIVALIENLVVFQDYRGKGVGSLLFSKVEEWAFTRGVKRAILPLDKNKPQALKFFQNRGWQETKLYNFEKKPKPERLN